MPEGVRAYERTIWGCDTCDWEWPMTRVAPPDGAMCPCVFDDGTPCGGHVVVREVRKVNYDSEA